MIVAVLGGGNGAHTMAAELSLAGHEVRLCEHPDYAGSIAAAKSLGGIAITGQTANKVPPGFAKVHLITTDIAAAIAGAQVLMVVMSANGQRPMIELMAPHLEAGQVVVFSPGYFGALECMSVLRARGLSRRVIVAETESLVYVTRLVGPAEVHVRAVKSEVRVAAIPAKLTGHVVGVIRNLYPQFSPDLSVLSTSLNNINYINHPISVLMNASRIEKTGPYRYDFYDISPSVGRVMSAVDEERMEIAAALGVPRTSAVEILGRFYGAKGANVYEAIRDSYAYVGQTSPPHLRYRYITEDIPYGYVPMASLAGIAGVRAEAINTVISLASLANGEDYRALGRGPSRLGIEGMSAQEIARYVTDGPDH